MGLVLGTPLYMSPEQVKGQQITGVSDLFSLGSTLFQLLCGEPPFTAASDLEVMRRIVQEPHADIRAFRPEIPEGKKGWGAKGNLDLDRVRSLGPAEKRSGEGCGDDED
mgnify:CR=1 FL=1